jgi:hypothetical protein
VILAPSVVLERGQRYSLLALGAGLLANIAVVEEERPLLFRWGDLDTESEWASYCVAPPPYADETPAETLVAGDLPKGVLPGIDAKGTGQNACIRISLEESGREFFVPPPAVGQFLIEPTPLERTERAHTSFVPHQCSSGASHDQTLEDENGCLWVDGSALGLRVEPGDYFLSVRQGETEVLSVLFRQEASVGVRFFGPLPPEANLAARLVVLDGREVEVVEGSEVILRTGAPLERFVLTEVLADPLGSEPASEWAEVLNVGTSAGSLAGYEITDEGGGVLLPDTVLQPGVYGLIVREDFAPGPDILPDAATIPIWVSSLGQNGLRNSGESLTLVDPSGRSVSSIVAGKASAGESLARLRPWAPDLETSFAIHGAPGASPGAPNAFSDED